MLPARTSYSLVHMTWRLLWNHELTVNDVGLMMLPMPVRKKINGSRLCWLDRLKMASLNFLRHGNNEQIHIAVNPSHLIFHFRRLTTKSMPLWLHDVQKVST